MEHKLPTKIFALGGIEEIGKNMYVCEYDDEIWVIDCGIKFADKKILLGFNLIICPFDYLVQNQKKIKGLIVTHGHEDHIGGIPYLLKTINIQKIYAGKLTKCLIEKKLNEHKISNTAFEIISDDSNIKSKHFDIDFFRVCHSISDAFGVCLNTPNGRIVTTGDFRFDFLTHGDETDIRKVGVIGMRGVDVLLCETTNAMTPGFSISEKYIIDELKNVIKKCNGRIFITIFASNVNRIEEIIKIAAANGRKIVLGGRSMLNIVEISLKQKIINIPINYFIEMRDAVRYRPEELLFLTTGSQGEEMAALNQIATGKHNYIKFNSNDTVIFSSNPIPGNYENVERLFNEIYKTGANVILSNSEKKIHSSGHATQTEIQLLLKLINPKYIIPIHGEFKMLEAMKKNCEDVEINDDHILQIANGQIVELIDHNAKISNENIEIYDVYVDGNEINKNSVDIIKYRKILSEEGIISVSLAINKKEKTIPFIPIITVRGTFYAKSFTNLITKMGYTIKDKVIGLLNNNNWEIDEKKIKLEIKNICEYFIWSNRKKKPIISSSIFTI